MAADPRVALDKLFAAFREHMELAIVVEDPDDDAVLDAAESLGDAFDDYDEALFQVTGVDTPLDNLDGYDEDDEDGDEVEVEVEDADEDDEDSDDDGDELDDEDGDEDDEDGDKLDDEDGVVEDNQD